MTDVRQEIRMKGEMPFVEEISRDFSLRLGVGIDAVHQYKPHIHHLDNLCCNICFYILD